MSELKVTQIINVALTTRNFSTEGRHIKSTLVDVVVKG